MKSLFTGTNREKRLQEMEKQVFDLLVIGGGITGAGIALDAASRGLKPALVEMQDFAAGTSSRSTKLVHGGLRYLKQLDVKIVAEVGKERAIVYENGPHVTTPEWMLLPIYAGGTFGKWSTSIGLRVYDYLAGVKKAERRRMLNAQETLKREPLLGTNGLKGSGYYVEYRTDDARLTIEVMKKAVELGAGAINYTRVEELVYEHGKLTGVEVVDLLSGRKYWLKAKKIINATGPWVDTLREQDRSKRGKTLHLTKGVHLVFDQKRFPLRQAIYFDTPDNRMVFAIPRDGKTYVGTTDTNYKGDKVNPQVTRLDRTYLLNAVNTMFVGLKLTERDVESSWSGLRPLIHQEGKDPSEISRRDEVLVSDSGLISIAGGKLTGYRKMAEAVVNLAAGLLEQGGAAPIPASRTKRLPLSGGDVGGSDGLAAFRAAKLAEAQAMGLEPADAVRLVGRYGSNVSRLFGLVRELAGRGDAGAGASASAGGAGGRAGVGASAGGADGRAGAGADAAGVNGDGVGVDSGRTALEEAVVRAEVQYAVNEEMAVKPVDFFIRRTGALYFDIEWVKRWKTQVLDWMSDIYGWSSNQTAAYAEELERRLQEAVVPADRDHF
ncbi:glycerol-3-phosphate dehydrogenase/oxidase [Paenibacillus koleovorans]|uniref:glycerol-3-phosphate dehydrogenase/oxidase n=1 Tax=Paenibacillus koleovorans TaxID=121608 RepID=UPI000FD7E0B3|nr:glycerol-3-phosphate dehydrogenase/oxidase [Paenibacillus koleovorans]